MSDPAARVAAATGVALDRAAFYLDAAAGDEAGAVAMIRGAKKRGDGHTQRAQGGPPRAARTHSLACLATPAGRRTWRFRV
jgi:hypothetical protein